MLSLFSKQINTLSFLNVSLYVAGISKFYPETISHLCLQDQQESDFNTFALLAKQKFLPFAIN